MFPADTKDTLESPLGHQSACSLAHFSTYRKSGSICSHEGRQRLDVWNWMKAEKEVSPSRRVFSLHACKHLEILQYGCLCCCLEIKLSTVREFLQVLVPSQTPLLPRKRAAAEHPRGASGFNSFWPFFCVKLTLQCRNRTCTITLSSFHTKLWKSSCTQQSSQGKLHSGTRWSV